MRADRRPLAMIGAAGALEAGALVLLGAQPHAWALLFAGLLHITAAAVVLRLHGAEPTRRLLAAAMTFSLPLIGVAMAVLMVGVRGRGGDELLARYQPVQRSESGAELARRLTAGGPICEALVAVDAETRNAAVSSLQRDADARAITLLRWSLAQPDPDPALEAALALEELGARYAERSAEACARAECRPSRDSALAAAEAIASAIHNGLADPALRPAIAAQARGFYCMAAQLDEQRAGELAWARARLELAMLDPEAALALVEPVLAANAGDERLLELYRDAAHAARRFDLLPPAEALPLVEELPPAASLHELEALHELDWSLAINPSLTMSWRPAMNRGLATSWKLAMNRMPRDRSESFDEAEPRDDAEDLGELELRHDPEARHEPS